MTEVFEEVENPAEDVVEEAPAEEAKPKAAAKRPEIPTGYGTPIQFAHALTDKLQAEGKLGENEPFKPQQVYSYIRNKAKDNPIPVVYVTPDGIEHEEQVDGTRPAFRKNGDGVLQEALDWWDEKDRRVAQRKANAAAKKAKKTEKAEPEVTEAVEVADEEVTEAE